MRQCRSQQVSLQTCDANRESRSQLASLALRDKGRIDFSLSNMLSESCRYAFDGIIKKLLDRRAYESGKCQTDIFIDTQIINGLANGVGVFVDGFCCCLNGEVAFLGQLRFYTGAGL